MISKDGSLPKATHLEVLADSVVKHFTSREDFQRELDVYSRGISSVPRLIDQQAPESITIKRIHGVPYLDAKPCFSTQMLATAVTALHGAIINQNKCLCHIDNQPKNILATEKKYYLIDFSDSRMDYPETDITHLMLFWAEEFTICELEPLCRSFLSSYRCQNSLDSGRWRDCLQQSITRFDDRRCIYRGPLYVDRNPAKQANRQFLASLASMF